MSILYKLTSVYEFDKKFDGANSSIRIEIFENCNDDKYRRVRVWAKRSYDLYPTFINSNKSKDEKVYSSDFVAIDISNLITDDLSIIEGKLIQESDLLHNVIDSINKLTDIITE